MKHLMLHPDGSLFLKLYQIKDLTKLRILINLNFCFNEKDVFKDFKINIILFVFSSCIHSQNVH